MQIQVRRRGGFAGLDEKLANVDLAGLGSQQASDLERRVRDVGFFDLPATLPDLDVGADQFEYAVTVTEADVEHTVTYRAPDLDQPVSTPGGADRPGNAAETVSAVAALADAALRAR